MPNHCSLNCYLSKFSGFQYCDLKDEKFCDIITDSSFPVFRHDEVVCSIERKRTLDVKFEETFKETLDRLAIALNEKRLKVEHIGQSIVFHRMSHIRKRPEIELAQIFEKKLSGQRFKRRVMTKKINRLMDLDSCYRACIDSNNEFDCDSFSFCKRRECNLASIGNGQLTEIVEEDSNCDVYTVSHLRNFEQFSNRQAIVSGTTINRYSEVNSAQCAELCVKTNTEQHTRQKCQSIELCLDERLLTTCRLLSNNYSIWNIEQTTVDDANCNIFSTKQILNFRPTTLSNFENAVIRQVETIDQCATSCDIAGDCEMFNYCETDSVNVCKFQSKNQNRNKTSSADNLDCVSYVRRQKLVAPLPHEASKFKGDHDQVHIGRGYKMGTLILMGVLFLLIGLFIGAIGFRLLRNKK